MDTQSACLMQALLNRVMVSQVNDNSEWLMLAPKRLGGVVAQIRLGGEADGLLNGQPIRLKRDALDEI